MEDYWRTVVDLPRYQSLDWRVLWEQHNEHRIVIPELIYAIDDRLFGAHEYLPLALSVVCQLLTTLLFAWVLWKDKTLPANLRLAAILLSGILMGWPGITYVLSWPFLLQWTLVQFLVAAAILVLQRDRLVVTLIVGVIVTFCSGHGMLAWPVFLAAAVILRTGKKSYVAILATAALSIALYFYRLVPSADSQRRAFLHDPSWFFGFLASMLSMPFGADSRVFGLTLGAANFVLVVAVLWRAWRRKILAHPTGVMLFSYLTFSLLVVLVCGMGRTLATAWDYPTAKVARYLSVPVSYWAVLILATIWTLARSRFGTRSGWVAVAVAFVGLAIGLPQVNPWLSRQLDTYSRVESAMVSVETGVRCDSLIATDLYPRPGDIWKWIPILKDRKLSVYSNDYFERMGKPIAALFHGGSGESVLGSVSTVIPFGCAMQLAGWIGGGERDFVLVNEKGVIAGLARRMRTVLPLYLPNRWVQPPVPDNWTGFVDYNIASETVQPYAVLGNGRVAPFGRAVPIAPKEQRTF